MIYFLSKPEGLNRTPQIGYCCLFLEKIDLSFNLLSYFRTVNLINFAIICGLFEWKRICAENVSFVYIGNPIEIQLQVLRVDGCDLINRLSAAKCCACPTPGPGFPTSYVMVFLCSVR